MSQKALLRIVQTWSLSEKPEYRGFRCASCQKYMRKAWYHWLKEGGYRTPVHFCNGCESDFKSSNIKVNKPLILVNRAKFGLKFPEKVKIKLGKIADGWNTNAKPVYKTFTCDDCSKKMHKAYHVWFNINRILSEAHFCKKCGDKYMVKIKGVIYDLDGTLVKKPHEVGWLYAGKKFNISISPKMLLNQKGISDEAASLMMVPKDKKHLLEKFKQAKIKYIKENIDQMALYPYVIKTISQLRRNGYKVWICTSAHKYSVKKILDIFPALRKIKNNIVWREMYKKEKPLPEALNLTTRKMGLTNSQVYYIGDALSDYRTGIKARVKFIYFCPNVKKRDLRIPKSILTISSHKEIFKLLK